jgi:hypothetical protein
MTPPPKAHPMIPTEEERLVERLRWKAQALEQRGGMEATVALLRASADALAGAAPQKETPDV